MNRKLKASIVISFGTIAEASRQTGIREDRLSRIIHRTVNARPEEKRVLAWHLQKPIAELFGDS